MGKNITFVCHGNICRSPMAEFVMKHLVRQRGLQGFCITSCATSTEEIGNDVHPGTKRKLAQVGIPVEHREARQITKADYANNDLIIAMDYENLYYLNRILGDDTENKIHLLLEFAPESYDGGVKSRHGKIKEIADPWYTGNFDDTFDDVLAGCIGLLDFLYNN
ncbi:MAG: low molecular weight phosphotyrosine protein phosphatase [Treponema sp.]|nr:low molecular weight phosphotyrosine protein phosphatase [Treponema sp.]